MGIPLILISNDLNGIHIMSVCVHVGLKRVTLMKDPVKGIGCTIKNAAGHIFVNRIIEDGPIALTGVLRPGWYMCLFLCLIKDMPSIVKLTFTFT